MKFGLFEDTEKIQVLYNLERKAIEFWGTNILSKPETWQSSGKIVSMLDLPETQLIIELEYDGAVTFFAKGTEVHLERINLPQSIYVILGVADRRSWRLRKLELYKGPSGITNFVYSFPKTYEEILKEPNY